MCLNIGTLKIINFPLGTNGKLMILGVSILMYIMIYLCTVSSEHLLFANTMQLRKLQAQNEELLIDRMDSQIWFEFYFFQL